MPSTDLIRLVTGATGALVVLLLGLALFIADKIHTDKAFQREIARGGEYKNLFEEERDAHQLTRQALAVANERAEAAVESARVTKLLLEEMRSHWNAPQQGRRRRAAEE